jgi:predicted regulator of Ras-like GTPase activity (Roadblock/LC7/MglB family)
MSNEKKNLEEPSSEVEPIAVEEVTCEDKMRPLLKEIKKSEGVVGCILRNATSAAIDINDPSKVTDYAILSSSALEAGEQLSELFDLGKIKNITVEGKDSKTLHLTIDENAVSIFMEKTADTKKTLKKILEKSGI